MADLRVFAPVGPFTLGELAARTGAGIAAGVDRGLSPYDIARSRRPGRTR